MADMVSFITQLAATRLPGMYEKKHEKVTYPNRIPNLQQEGMRTFSPWTRIVEFYSGDMQGRADWDSNGNTSAPTVSLTQEKLVAYAHSSNIGFSYTEDDYEAAALAGDPFNTIDDRNMRAAVMGSELTIQQRLYDGAPEVGWDSLFNSSLVAGKTVDASGTGASDALKRLWANKTPEQILVDINETMVEMWTDTLEYYVPNTLILPQKAATTLTTKVVPYTSIILQDWIARSNFLTLEMGEELRIEYDRRLNASNKALLYRRDPECLGWWDVMPLNFRTPKNTVSRRWDVEGMFRMIGLNWFIPKAGKYLTGVTA